MPKIYRKIEIERDALVINKSLISTLKKIKKQIETLKIKEDKN